MESGNALGIRLAHRDETALAEAYALFGPRLLSYISRIVGPADAEDVLQRTFLDAWRLADRFDPARQRFSSWLFTIARSRALDTRRARRRRPTVELTEDVGDDRRDEAERLADIDVVRRALAQLPEHERAAVELRYLSQLSQREVADRLGLPLGTVKARIARGVRRLAHIVMPISGPDSGSNSGPNTGRGQGHREDHSAGV